jgi:hypothetical protein
MDIVAHGLWAGAAGAAANLKLRRKVRFLHTLLWGVFPDLFAFMPVFVVLLLHGIPGEATGFRIIFSRALREALPPFLRPEALYPLSHSLPVFLAVFLAAWLLFRRPVLPLLAWPLHILMDIPTHAAGAFRTPFLWPLSSYRFSGFWWSERWFMILNYSLLAAAYLALFVWPLVQTRWTQRQCGGAPPEVDRSLPPPL